MKNYKQAMDDKKGKLVFSKKEPFDRLTDLRGNAGGRQESSWKTGWVYDENTVHKDKI